MIRPALDAWLARVDAILGSDPTGGSTPTIPDFTAPLAPAATGVLDWVRSTPPAGADPTQTKASTT